MNHTPGCPRAVAIVGGGFSGTMAAIHLRRLLPRDCAVHLFDRTGRFARGPAYAASDTKHLLNARALNMSALPDEPEHFDRWLEGRPETEIARTDVGVFATRRLYGTYLRALLHDEIRASGGRVRLRAGEVVAVDADGPRWRVTLGDGTVSVADAVVLAIGNLPPREPPDGVVWTNPWSDEATGGLRLGEPALIVGTGLTMVDLALAMRARGFDGPIIAVSRRALLPRRHRPAGGVWVAPEFSAHERHSVLALLRRVRAEIGRAAEGGVDWRAVIDGLRPVAASLWRGLPATERARFLRHLRPFWDVCRHRMAPPVADRLDAALADGGLEIRRARVVQVRPEGRRARVVLQPAAGAAEEIVAQRVIYATGPRGPDEGDQMIAGLCSAGLARLDVPRMGVAVTDRLEVVGADGGVTPGLWALGPLVRGTLWECTAVSDIRGQARDVAAAIAARLADGSVAMASLEGLG